MVHTYILNLLSSFSWIHHLLPGVNLPSHFFR